MVRVAPDHKLVERLRDTALITLGLLLAAMPPPALWIAWTETMLIAFLVGGIAAGVLYCVIARLLPEEPPARFSRSSHR